MTTLTVDELAPIPVATITSTGAVITGSCLANNPRGTDPYIYALFPVNTGTYKTASFWRYTRRTNAWQICAAPSGIGGNAYFSANELIYDVSRDCLWLIHPLSASPFVAIQRYTPSTDTWATMAQAGGDFAAAGVAAQWSNELVACHPCPALNIAASDDFIYVAGNGATTFYRYTISTDAVDTRAALGTALAPNTTNSGAMLWHPGRNLVYCFMANAGQIDSYNIGTNTWTASVAYTPTLEVAGEACLDPRTLTAASGRILVVDQAHTDSGMVVGGRIYSVSPALDSQAVGTLNLFDSAWGYGHGTVAYVEDGRYYVVSRKHGQKTNASWSFQQVQVA